MEIVIFIAVIRWFSQTATISGRTPYLWGIAGGIIYLAALILTKAALYAILPALDAIFGEYIFAFGVVDLVISNAVALGCANFACRRLFKENLVIPQRFVQVVNMAWLVFASVILLSVLIALISDGGEFGTVLSVLGPAALVVVPLGTRHVYTAKYKDLPVPPWQIHLALWANLAAALALIWYVTTLKLSHPVAFSISTAYYTSWIAVAACLNTISLGLTIRSSRRGKPRG